MKTLDTLKAVASSGAIAAWIVWRDYPLLWSGIIAAAQVADALKGVFPFTSIYQGAIAADTINKRRTKLRKLQLEAERKHFPDGFEPGRKLVELAAEEARAYIEMISVQETGE